MSAISYVEAFSILPAAAPLSRKTFTGWRINDNGTVRPQPLTGDTLADAAQSLASEPAFGQRFCILERDAVSGHATLHSYVIRRGKWNGHYAPFGTRKKYPYYADLLISIRVTEFVPVEPWGVTRDCDAVSGDAGFIEGRAA